MLQELLIGAALLGLGAFLLFIGVPNKAGESPRFLQFNAAPMLYPPVILVLFAMGAAALIAGFFHLR